MITKNYIKICEKAEDMQKAWKPKVGDWMYFKKLKKTLLITIVKKEVVEYIDPKTKEDSWCYKENIKIHFAWLLVQEQLQEMVLTENILENTWSLGWLIENIYNFSENKYEYIELPEHYAFKNFNTVNELWLAFVMYKKYHKIWNGDDWVINE